jgi:hypothetical protein
VKKVRLKQTKFVKYQNRSRLENAIAIFFDSDRSPDDSRVCRGLFDLWIDYLKSMALQQSFNSPSASTTSNSVNTSGGLRILGVTQSTGRCIATSSHFAAAW